MPGNTTDRETIVMRVDSSNRTVELIQEGAEDVPEDDDDELSTSRFSKGPINDSMPDKMYVDARNYQTMR